MVFFLFWTGLSHSSTFVHPGITHKKSDLDRMKYMVQAKIDPWYSSYQQMVADSKSSFNYTVQGDPSFIEVGRDNGVNYSAWKSDCRAAYYNAIRWIVEEDPRYAQKAIEIFNAWTGIQNVTSNGTRALSGGTGYIMIEAAELIKSTYAGWTPESIQAFKDMLVYPGYSNTTVPAGVGRTYGSFYWQSYQGDAGRHGNQGLSGWRTVMAMGIFLDNEIMYDRALRYIQGLPHRSDDLAYPAGPPSTTGLINSDEYSETYSTSSANTIEDYGYNELINHYIWETGQSQESSRDQQHVLFGLGLIQSMAEMAWNQGYDLYGFNNHRLLKGLEYSMRYNVSAVQSFPDQPTPWEPTVADGNFMEGFDRTKRWYSKAISPIGRGDFPGIRPLFEISVAHYLGRGIKTDNEAKWVSRARDYAIEKSGYEQAGWTNDAIGWGALTARRAEYCYGDPISGFDSTGHPIFSMNVLPMTLEAENFDYFVTSGNGKSYSDATTENTGGEYRTDEAVDIAVRDDVGYVITHTETGEFLIYTVAVPVKARYNLAIQYAAQNSESAVSVHFDGINKTGTIRLPSTNGASSWITLPIVSEIVLNEGVQSMKVAIESGGLELNSITITESINSEIKNLALNGTASQSSTDYGGTAELAIDGNTDGDFGNGSVSHTSAEDNAWWQVDWGSDTPIGQIKIFNRTGSNYGDRLSNFTVILTNTSGDTTYSQTFQDPPNPSLIIDMNNQIGNSLRIQLNEFNPLSLAEVEVWEGESIEYPVQNLVKPQNLSWNSPQGAILEIFNFNGQKIIQKELDQNSFQDVVRTLPSGLYILRLNRNGETITRSLFNQQPGAHSEF